jgi:predicted regulator of Ras-like GTPase activity (Roadblock/LC7/MglB family)
MSTLTGRIEAIGILELLRVPITNGNTGRLVVYDDDQAAELFYAEGQLVQARAGSLSASECLCQVMRWSRGEFEFFDEQAIEVAQRASHLHEELLTEIKAWYAERVARRTASGTMLAAAPVTSPPAHAGGSGKWPKAQLAPTASCESVPPVRPTHHSRTVPKAPPCAALGTAMVDKRGNIVEHSGAFDDQNAALAALAYNLGTTIGQKLCAGSLRAIELKGGDDKWLFVKPRADSLATAQVLPNTDFGRIFPES